jgi:mono/diheme cytochrome c family protein
MNRVILTGMIAAAVVGVVVLPVMAGDRSGAEPKSEDVAEGERLVHNLDCDVCHTPKVMTPTGPQPDSSRRLSGHRAGETLPPIPEGIVGEDGWGGLFNPHLTAWVGPWGVSYGSNLTPDEATGIGAWSEDLFVESMRTGTDVGELRPFLPPMPTYGRLTDGELHAIFAYLRSIAPISNEVPRPMPPRSAPSDAAADP